MTRYFVLCVAAGLLSGCAVPQTTSPSAEAPEAVSAPEGVTRPVARPANLNTDIRPVSETAKSVEEFDTTTAEQRAKAAEVPDNPVAERLLGTTVATLGSPAEPGFWLKTPLVDTAAKGRVVYDATGKSVAVDLIPIDGPKTAGSRLSLAALRLIEAPLTGLPEVKVFLLP